ncbi:MAG: histidine kinase [Gammaproteobacteria bacterium RIFOXYA12_FULL_61_12]|nr:MAG: histidine kinase [Gammaproteobacteria bacterium RIFOXYD12_FULL_61_37]OGT92011.1 MAG: histidine kinase [Gammaproteobacteria bacterium RIFOXYA12_FULL_61_12]
MPKLRIMLVDDKPGRRQALQAQILCADCEIIAAVDPSDDLLELISHHRPDVVIIDMDAPGRDTLENLRTVQSTLPRPMVMFSQDGDRETIRRAVEAGVSAYVVDGVQPKRVRPILDAAIARFEQFRNLSTELDKTRMQLLERKSIERAKGLIMSRRRLPEQEAYQLLRKAAMDRNLRMAEVADQIIAAADLLGNSG